MSPVASFRFWDFRSPGRGIFADSRREGEIDQIAFQANAFHGERLSVGVLLSRRVYLRRASHVPPPSYSMGMTSRDAALTSTPGSRTMIARKMSSSATCCRSGETSVTSSCGENSGVRWQMST